MTVHAHTTSLGMALLMSGVLAITHGPVAAEASEILLNCHGKWADVRTKVERPYVVNIPIASDGAWIQHEGLARSSEKSDEFTWRYFGKPDPAVGTFDDYNFRFRTLELDVFGRERREGKDELVSVRTMSCVPVRNPFLEKHPKTAPR